MKNLVRVSQAARLSVKLSVIRLYTVKLNQILDSAGEYPSSRKNYAEAQQSSDHYFESLVAHAWLDAMV